MMNYLKGPFVVFASVALATSVTARPNPEGPADFADEHAAWAANQALWQASPFAGLEDRAIGPIVQGGRLVDIEVVPREP